MCVFRPVCGFPKLPLLPELLVVHVEWAPVRYSDERRGFHCHIKGRCHCTQRPAAAYTLDYANLRSGLSTCLCLCLHCRHVCRGLLASVCLFFLSCLLDVSRTDDQGVVLFSSALQSWGPGQLVSHSGPPLVHLLALSTNPITVTWRWNQLSGHRFPRTCSLTVDCRRVNGRL